ncbi:MAG: hypothetical protein GF313_11505, partial [Caldithrix sp.]|nr:hypothetical protein [Caldithrix sp.]
MIDKTKNISFNTFFMNDLLERTLQDGKKKFQDEHYTIYEALIRFLTSEEDMLTQIEKLAHLQGTSELSIFLFDLKDRAQDASPVSMYDKLEQFKDDFLNLLSLMLEDQESFDDLRTVLAEYLQEAEVTSTSEPEDEPDLSFDEYYGKAFYEYLERQLKNSSDSAQSDSHKTIINVVSDHQKTQQTNVAEMFDQPLTEVVQTINLLWPAGGHKTSYTAMMDHLEERVTALVQQLNRLQEEDPSTYENIVNNKALPELQPKETADKPGQKTESDENINDLLQLYFQTEVDEHLELLRQTIEDAKKRTQHQIPIHDLIKRFKSLKEISMIHGYDNLEFMHARLVKFLSKAHKEDLRFQQDAYDIFDVLFNELSDIRQFLEKHEHDFKDYVDDFVEKLTHSMHEPPEDTGENEEPEKEIEEAKPVTSQPEDSQVEESMVEEEPPAEVEESEEELIGLDDREKILNIAREIFSAIFKTVKPFHVELNDEEKRSHLFKQLEQFRESTSLI